MSINSDFVKGQKAAEILGVHQRTLYLWEEKGLIETIRTPSNHRLYNVKKYLDNLKCENKACENLEELNNKEKLNICYVRVSSNGQKDDLERQKEQMVNKYPNHVLIEDIGSGLNLNKRGIKKIIKLAIEGKINELVVAYRDRLTRFGFELIEELIEEYSGGKIIILNEKEKIEPEEELVKDIMAIMNVYVIKMNGLRKYKLHHEENEKK
jgi:predicted site-specific integrase-resolvase